MEPIITARLGKDFVCAYFTEDELETRREAFHRVLTREGLTEEASYFGK